MEKLALEVKNVQNLFDPMEGQRQNLESEAFGKAAAQRPARGNQF